MNLLVFVVLISILVAAALAIGIYALVRTETQLQEKRSEKTFVLSVGATQTTSNLFSDFNALYNKMTAEPNIDGQIIEFGVFNPPLHTNSTTDAELAQIYTYTLPLKQGDGVYDLTDVTLHSHFPFQLVIPDGVTLKGLDGISGFLQVIYQGTSPAMIWDDQVSLNQAPYIFTLSGNAQLECKTTPFIHYNVVAGVNENLGHVYIRDFSKMVMRDAVAPIHIIGTEGSEMRDALNVTVFNGFQNPGFISGNAWARVNLSFGNTLNIDEPPLPNMSGTAWGFGTTWLNYEAGTPNPQQKYSGSPQHPFMYTVGRSAPYIHHYTDAAGNEPELDASNGVARNDIAINDHATEDQIFRCDDPNPGGATWTEVIS